MTEVSRRWRDFQLPDKYEIESVLGEGGFGIVYKVRNLDMERREALKVIDFEHATLPSDKLREDFLREARIMDALARRSKYIVRVFELGLLGSDVNDREAGYFSMEFIPGRTLHRMVLDHGPLPIDRALRLVTQITRALEVAHTQKVRDQVGILHRDLKLENALLVDSEEGEQVRILDFGLSKPASETGSSRTVQLGAMVTLGCAPPEQLSTKMLGPPADIHALGVLLYELVTAHEPWFGRPLPGRISQPEAMDLLLASTEPEPVPLSRFFNGNGDPRVAQIEALVRRCLRVRPEDRVQSAEEFREAIRGIQGEEPRGGRLDELYSRATEALQAEAWDEAATHLREIVEWDTHYRDAADKLREATRRSQLSALYAEARQKHEAEDWTGVLEVFNRIGSVTTDFPDAENLRDSARRALETAEREKRLSGLYDGAVEAMGRSGWTEAIERLETLLESDSSYRDADVKLAEATRQRRLRELYDEARRESREENWTTVVDVFERIHEIEPDYADVEDLLGVATRAIEAAERQRRLADLYESALAEAEAERWSEAATVLESVVQLAPDYRDAAVRLAEARRQARLADLYEEARERGEAEDWAGVEEVLARLRHTEPSYPDPDGLAEAARQAIEREERERRLEGLYERARRAIQASAWPEAIQALEAIVEVDADYLDAAVRLAEARRQKRLAELYDEARAKGDDGDWSGVIDALERLRHTEPSYPDPDGLAEAAREAIERAERERGLAELYERALSHLDASAWSEAIETLEAAVDLDPDYRDVSERLAHATRRVRLAGLYEEAKEKGEAEDWEAVTQVFDRLKATEPEYPDPEGLQGAAERALAEAEERREREAALEARYAEGVRAEESSEWEEATRLFRAVVEEEEGYRDAAERLEEATRQVRLADLYEEAKEKGEAEDWEAVTQVFDRLKATEPEYPDPEGLQGAAERALAEAEERREREAALEARYAEGVRAEESSEWEEATRLFRAVVEEEEGYRDAAERLEEATRQVRLADLYEEAKEKGEAEDWEAVTQVFDRLKATEPEYPDPEGLQGAAERALAEAEERREREAALEARYAEGVRAEESSEWEEATRLFRAVVEEEEGYRDAAERLEEATRQVRLADLYEEAKEKGEAEDWEAVTQVFDRISEIEPDRPDPEGILAAARRGLEESSVDITEVVDVTEPVDVTETVDVTEAVDVTEVAGSDRSEAAAEAVTPEHAIEIEDDREEDRASWTDLLREHARVAAGAVAIVTIGTGVWLAGGGDDPPPPKPNGGAVTSLSPAELLGLAANGGIGAVTVAEGGAAVSARGEDPEDPAVYEVRLEGSGVQELLSSLRDARVDVVGQGRSTVRVSRSTGAASTAADNEGLPAVSVTSEEGGCDPCAEDEEAAVEAGFYEVRLLSEGWIVDSMLVAYGTPELDAERIASGGAADVFLPGGTGVDLNLFLSRAAPPARLVQDVRDAVEARRWNEAVTALGQARQAGVSEAELGPLEEQILDHYRSRAADFLARESYAAARTAANECLRHFDGDSECEGTIARVRGVRDEARGEAERLLAEADLPGAVAAANACLTGFPGDPRCTEVLEDVANRYRTNARSAFQQQDHQDAVDVAEECLAHFAGDPECGRVLEDARDALDARPEVVLGGRWALEQTLRRNGVRCMVFPNPPTVIALTQEGSVIGGQSLESVDERCPTDPRFFQWRIDEGGIDLDGVLAFTVSRVGDPGPPGPSCTYRSAGPVAPGSSEIRGNVECGAFTGDWTLRRR